jgi:uncharacterized membrane protein YfcA
VSFGALLGCALAGLVAGVLNTLAGGASALVLPVLLGLGLDPHTANASNRVAVLAQTAVAVSVYRRAGAPWAPRVEDAAPAVLGGLAGAALSLAVSAEGLRTWMSLALLGVVPALLWPPAPGAGRAWAPAWRWAAMAAVGVWGGFLQVGAGFLLVAALTGPCGRSLREANAVKVALVGLFTVPALLTFIGAGVIAWGPAGAVALGAAAGGGLGAQLAGRLPERALRGVVVAAVVVCAAALGLS